VNTLIITTTNMHLLFSLLVSIFTLFQICVFVSVEQLDNCIIINYPPPLASRLPGTCLSDAVVKPHQALEAYNSGEPFHTYVHPYVMYVYVYVRMCVCNNFAAPRHRICAVKALLFIQSLANVFLFFDV